LREGALLKVFGQAGDGIFAAPSVIEEEVQQRHNVKVVGRSDAIREKFYAISVERFVKHPAVVARQKAAYRSIFATEEK